MKAKKDLKKFKGLGKVTFWLLFCLSSFVNAAPGTLSDVPLYMGTGAEPNVLWVVDDSGSMDYEVLKRRSAEASSTGYPWDGGNYENDEDNVVVNPERKEELLEACLGYNALAYNPAITYIPWVAANGASFPQHDVSDLTDVPKNPLDLNGDTEDLSDAKYVLWNDDGDGEFDRGECGEQVDDISTAEFDAGSVSELRSVSELEPDQQRNYTNWYTYYRKRAYVMKAILSGVFSDAEDRFGLAVLKPNSYQGIPIGDMSDGNHKSSLIEKLLNVPADGNTPLGRALRNAGRYYHQDDSLNPSDGFVVASGAPANPIQYSCQANYTVMVTDGYRNESGSPISVGNVDGGTDNGFNGGPYADNESDTMADLAMYYYSSDLDSNQENNFRSNNPRDTNSAQHMVTYAVAFGVEGNIDTTLIADSNGVLQPPPIANSWTVNQNQWPTSIQNNSRETIDDLYHATFNSRGQFFNSGDPDEMRSDIMAILDAIAEETEGTAAAVGVNSTSISTDTLLFQAWFSSEDWSGELRAYKFATTSIGASSSSASTSSGSTSTSTSTSTSSGEGTGSSSSSGGESGTSSTSSGEASTSSSSSSGSAIDYDNFVLEWEASDVLEQRDLINSPRTLLTWSSTEDIDGNNLTIGSGKGIVFDTPTDFSTITSGSTGYNGELNYQHLSDLLSHSSVVAAMDNTSKQAALANLIAWINGDQANEGTLFRARERLLGDIVSSSPQYVGAPSELYPNHIESSTYPYLNFVSAKKNRTPMVYVGSNDGMLHAFKASDGTEVFAYLPEVLFTDGNGRGYHALAELDYSHVPYVDGSPTVADVFVNNAWKTYLVGTLNGGGKGVFVLDVTDPVSEINATPPTPEEIVVTEFTHANLGYTYARAQIGRLNNGKWAAIFGNGYNNNGSGEASLFILYLDGSGFKEISTNIGTIANSDCADPSSDCNGLSSPSILDITRDGIVDRVYAGDLHGNMWAFDLSSSDPNNWVIAHGASNDEPLFIACRDVLVNDQCPLAHRQPITAKPVIVGHRTERSLSTIPNLMVLFGTGQFVAENDPANTDEQSFYGVWDAGPNYGSLTRSRLVEQQIGTTTSTNQDGDSVTVRTITSSTVSYDEAATSGGAGWLMDLPASGERMVLTPLILGDYVAYVTSIPDSGVCTGGGSGWLMAVDIFSGEQPDIRIFNEITGATAGIPLANLSGGIIGLEDKLIGADSVGNINVYDYRVASKRPGTRASFKILR